MIACRFVCIHSLFKHAKMATVSTYLNFQGQTEEAFNFYKSVFKTEYCGEPMRFKDLLPAEGMPAIPDDQKNGIMHIMLPTIGGHNLMGTDACESMGQKVKFGNNIYINLEPDTIDEGRRLFEALSKEGQIEMPFEMQFWGDTFGSLIDRYGVQWMVNVAAGERSESK